MPQRWKKTIIWGGNRLLQSTHRKLSSLPNYTKLDDNAARLIPTLSTSEPGLGNCCTATGSSPSSACAQPPCFLWPPPCWLVFPTPRRRLLTHCILRRSVSDNRLSPRLLLHRDLLFFHYSTIHRPSPLAQYRRASFDVCLVDREASFLFIIIIIIAISSLQLRTSTSYRYTTSPPPSPSSP